MRTHFIEVTNAARNWGKFMLGAYDDDELQHKSQISPSQTLIRAVGDDRTMLWVLDLQTGEGARFATHGMAKYDLDKHRIWVCPMFEPFLAWIYANKVNGLTDLSSLPSVLDLADADFSFSGYRRAGPTVEEQNARDKPSAAPPFPGENSPRK